MRIFVVIANYGHKNKAYLTAVLQELGKLPFDVTIEILSESVKDYGPDIRVRVGLPGKSPWTLPFGYKQSFLERRDEFDLYVYTEDDILITESHIRAFLDMTSILPRDMIAGFTRYERDEVGNIYYIDMFRAYHFVPGAISNYGGQVFAQLTNEHSGCFMLTKEHLRQVLSSPQFFRGPRKGKYNLPETAATEPYTQCGLTKVICISRISDFVVHHLPNKYWSNAAHCLATAKVLDAQLRAMLQIPRVENAQLFPARLKIDSTLWDKGYYLPVDQDAIDEIQPSGADVLSVGCGVGATELALLQKGHCVVSIPLDGIIASYAKEKGVRLLPSDLSLAFEELNGAGFDAIFLLDVVQYVDDPVALLKHCYAVLKKNGVLVLRTPNFLHSSLGRQIFEKNITVQDLLKLGSYKRSGLHATSKGRIKEWLAAAGFSCKKMTHIPGDRIKDFSLSPECMSMLPSFVTTREYLAVATTTGG